MQIINYGDYIEIIPENTYLTNLDETDLFEGICGKVNPANYKDITEEKANEILEKINKENEDGTQEEN